ncbi:MAG: methyltransferase domain-containing protein, partial [Candidatus Omnitrophota bacterium]
MCRDNRYSQVDGIFRQADKARVEQDLSPGFYKYYKSFFKDPYKLERYFLSAKNIFQVLRGEGKTILDVGCGHGLITIFMALLGAGEIIGVDENPDNIAVLNKILSRHSQALTNMRAETGDALSLAYGGNSFDILIITGALSHLREVSPFFSEAKRVLKKTGTLYISLDNNSFNLRGRIFRRRFWKQAEFGPIDTPTQTRSFLEMRKDIIRNYNPRMIETEVENLSRMTQGMWGKEITEAVEEFDKYGRTSYSPRFKYRDPYSGQIPEAELNPFKMANILRDYGFRVKVMRPFSCYTYPFINFPCRSINDAFSIIKAYIKRLVSVCYPVSLLLSPVVEIIAVK